MFYEVTRPALRRVRLREELPSDHPAILDEIAGLFDNLPDPALLCAEERAGSMASLATLRNRIEAYLTAVAGEADKAADSRVGGAGTTGMLVAVATCGNPAAGSAIVNRAAAFGEPAGSGGRVRGRCPERRPRCDHRRRQRAPAQDRNL